MNRLHHTAMQHVGQVGQTPDSDQVACVEHGARKGGKTLRDRNGREGERRIRTMVKHNAFKHKHIRTLQYALTTLRFTALSPWVRTLTITYANHPSTNAHKCSSYAVRKTSHKCTRTTAIPKRSHTPTLTTPTHHSHSTRACDHPRLVTYEGPGHIR